MSDHGDRIDGVSVDELIIIMRELVVKLPGIKDLTDPPGLLMIAVQIQRNAILNDTAIITGNLADAVSDLVQARAMTDYIPGERKN